MKRIARIPRGPSAMKSRPTGESMIATRATGPALADNRFVETPTPLGKDRIETQIIFRLAIELKQQLLVIMLLAHRITSIPLAFAAPDRPRRARFLQNTRAPRRFPRTRDPRFFASRTPAPAFPANSRSPDACPTRHPVCRCLHDSQNLNDAIPTTSRASASALGAMTRECRARSRARLRHRFAAILNSHGRSPASESRCGYARYARRNVSWKRSSASSRSWVMRNRKRMISRSCRRIASSNGSGIGGNLARAVMIDIYNPMPPGS